MIMPFFSRKCWFSVYKTTKAPLKEPLRTGRPEYSGEPVNDDWKNHLSGVDKIACYVASLRNTPFS